MMEGSRFKEYSQVDYLECTWATRTKMLPVAKVR